MSDLDRIPKLRQVELPAGTMLAYRTCKATHLAVMESVGVYSYECEHALVFAGACGETFHLPINRDVASVLGAILDRVSTAPDPCDNARG